MNEQANIPVAVIRKALGKPRDGRIVWCRKIEVAINATPCAALACPFKEGRARAASADELSECNGFQITTFAESFANTQNVLAADSWAPKSESDTPAGKG
jgi:hypothetical protein